MFLDASRYAKVMQETVTLADGRVVSALRLRPLPPSAGTAHAVQDNDRLDLLAQAGYADGTRFWHIADANSALDAARELCAETGATLTLPDER
ncbi:hypothetical protein [Plasticicumulans acidivorans]|uniref:Uncharacterized protein n=1 Tax=Plasticicumulans acidivorans TaxID=886464 RepID=A0A317MUB3_9GAMM|nr:hypothetical protein [Plasticicumulans acidivorans]PWV61199.1 hypothetical protein C7443_106213 [Plasticicumulans acidivorans]